jgi:hypothetical protein
MRRTARTDHTQQAIVDALRAAGCKVLSLAACGNGVPDLLIYKETMKVWFGEEYIGADGRFILLEVKNPAGRGIGLTPDQVKFHAEWPVTVVTSPEEALRAVGL